MKTAFLFLIGLLLSATVFAQKSYVSLEGKIENRNNDSLAVTAQGRLIKLMFINQDGRFKDTLHVPEGLYQLYDLKEVTPLYLKNGYNLKISVDASHFDETITYEGEGAKENNFLAKKVLADEKIQTKLWNTANDGEFRDLVSRKTKETNALLKEAHLDYKADRLFRDMIEQEVQFAQANFEKRKAISKLKDTVSPTFKYDNVKGGKTNLEDLRGKYVFIDVWATWCGPCIAEIPHLKKAEEKYHEKNIAFVGLSIDTRENSAKWKNFVAARQLGGIQVLADNDWRSNFTKAYSINSIPRFILIDPEGKIVDADAPRPSSPQFTEVMDKLLN